MIVEISVPSIPYDVVITCDKPGIIAATPNVPITVVVDVIRDGQPGETPVKGVDYFDGVDGITPVKGVDYFDGSDGITPVKGVDYFDGADGVTPVKGVDYFDGVNGITPVKGVDYFDGADGFIPVKGVDYFDGVTPVKGVDYFDGADGITPVKGVDYFDGVNGITPVKGVDYFDGELNLTEIIVDFGSISEASNNIVVTIANTSILSTSKVICMVSGSETTDHSTDEIMLMQLNAFASKFVSGVSFNIQVFSPYKVFGKIKVNYLITN